MSTLPSSNSKQFRPGPFWPKLFEYLTHHPELIAGSTAADPLWHNFAKLTPDKNGTMRTAKQWLASWQKRVFTAKQNLAAKKPTVLDRKTFDLLAYGEKMKAEQPPLPSNIASAVAPHEPVKMANLDRPKPTLLDRKTFDSLAFAEKIKTEQLLSPSNIVNAVAPYEPVNMSNLDIGMQASLQNSELSSNKQKLQPTEDDIVQYMFNNCNSNPDLLKQMIRQTLNLNNCQEKSHVPEDKLLIEDQEKSAMQKGGEDGENGEDEEDEEVEEDEEDEPEIPEMEVMESDENNPPMCQCPCYELLQTILEENRVHSTEMCETIGVGLYTMTQEVKKALVQAMANLILNLQ